MLNITTNHAITHTYCWFPVQFFMAVHIYLHMTPLRLPALTRFYLAGTLTTLSTHLSFHLSMATFGKVHEA